MDIISRLPVCAGQAADAVSAKTHVKMEDAPKLLKIRNRNVQTFGFVYHDTNGQNHGPVWKTQSFLLSEICKVILWQDCYGKCNLRKSYCRKLEKISNWKCLFVHGEKGLFLSVYVDDIRLAGKKQNIDPMWKVLNKEVDLGEPTSFLDHVYLGCSQRQCEIRKDMVRTEKLPYLENLRISSWSYDMEGHAKKCVWNGIVSWQTERLNNSTKYQLHALTTIISKKKN